MKQSTLDQEFTIERAIAIQSEQPQKWKQLLKGEVYKALEKWSQETNSTVKRPEDIRRGTEMSNFVSNYLQCHKPKVDDTELTLEFTLKVTYEIFEAIIVTAIEGGSNYWYYLPQINFKFTKTKTGPLSVRIAQELFFNPNWGCKVNDLEARVYELESKLPLDAVKDFRNSWYDKAYYDYPALGKGIENEEKYLHLKPTITIHRYKALRRDDLPCV